MPTYIKIEDLFLDADISALLTNLTEQIENIRQQVPNELLYLPNGEPNITNRWGAINFHISMARINLKAFV